MLNGICSIELQFGQAHKCYGSLYDVLAFFIRFIVSILVSPVEETNIQNVSPVYQHISH
jgi:hypothetical protein